MPRRKNNIQNIVITYGSPVSPNNIYGGQVTVAELFARAPKINGIGPSKARVLSVHSRVVTGASTTTQGMIHVLWNQDTTRFEDTATTDPRAKIDSFVELDAPSAAYGYIETLASNSMEGAYFKHYHDGPLQYTNDNSIGTVAGSGSVIGNYYVALPEGLSPYVTLKLRVQWSGQDTSSTPIAFISPLFNHIYPPEDYNIDFIRQCALHLSRDLTYSDGAALQCDNVLRLVTISEDRVESLQVVKSYLNLNVPLGRKFMFPKPEENGLMLSTLSRYIRCPMQVNDDETWYAHSDNFYTDCTLDIASCYQRERVLTPNNRSAAEILTAATNGSVALSVSGQNPVAVFAERRRVSRLLVDLRNLLPETVQEFSTELFVDSSPLTTAVSALVESDARAVFGAGNQQATILMTIVRAINEVLVTPSESNYDALIALTL